MSVLVADNDLQVCSLLVEVLRRAGLHTSLVHDGVRARALARHPGVRVLVCDLDMPGANGVEVLESLSDLARPPLAVVVSGYLDEQIRSRLRALPFVRAVLGKPFDLLEFAGIVQQLDATARGADSAALEQDAAGGPARPGDPKNAPRHA